MRHPLLSAFVAALLAGVAAAGPAAAQRVAGTSPQRVNLVVAATTDVHGNARGWDYFANTPAPRGLSRAATIIDSLRREAPGHVVLVDAGDLLQGTPLDYVAARVDTIGTHPMIAAMNAMHYDAAAVGNHEFNYGVPALRRAVAQAHFPFLAANATVLDSGRAFRPWTIIDRAGIRIGIVGATTPGSMLWDRDNLRGHFRIGDIVPAVRRAVDDVRRANASVVIVVVHTGLDEPSSYDTASSGVPSENVAARIAHEVPGIDLIVYGHSHRQMADTTIGNTLLVQPKNWAASVAVAHLEVEDTEFGWRVAAKRGQLVATAGHAEDPAVLAATEAAHRETVKYATTPIGETPVAWRADSARVVDTPLMDFILEVERKATGAQLASTAAFSLDASLPAGPVTVAEIAALYPYDNTLRVVRISGRQLREYLEFSSRYYRATGSGDAIVDQSVPGYNYDMVAGVDYVIDLSKPVGQRITTLTYQGRPVAPSDSFTFALNNYRQTGGGGYAMLRDARVIDDRQLEIRQLLIDEVRTKKVLRPEDYFHSNWRLLPESVVAEAYAAMHRSRRRESSNSGGADRANLERRSTRMPQRRVARRHTSPPSALIAVSNRRRSATPLLTAPSLRVIGTNDFHGQLEPRADPRGIRRGGAAYVAAAIDAARADCRPPACESVLVDGGDMFQGTPASNLASGRPVVDVYNRLGYVASALGNHEFDWGQDTLRAIMRAAHYAILGANVRFADGRDVPWIRDDTIVTRGPLHIGIIGVATISTAQTTRASNTTGLKFVDPAPVVDSLTRALRANGADAVIVLAHAGAFCARDGSTDCAGEIIDLAKRLNSHPDAIVSGHTHSLVNTEVNGIPVVQARSRGEAIDVVDVPLRSGSTPRHVVRNVLTDSLTPIADIAAIVAHADSAVAPLVGRTEARIATAMSQGAVGDLIADAMRASAGNGNAIAMMNNGGIRAPLRAGIATYGDLFEVQPFANVLYRITVRGADLRQYLERRVRGRAPDVHISGATVAYDPSRAPGARVTAVHLADGSTLADDRTYDVVLNDFMVTNDSYGFGAQALRTEPMNVVDLDALIAYVNHVPQPVAPPSGDRFVSEGAR